MTRLKYIGWRMHRGHKVRIFSVSSHVIFSLPPRSYGDAVYYFVVFGTEAALPMPDEHVFALSANADLDEAPWTRTDFRKDMHQRNLEVPDEVEMAVIDELSAEAGTPMRLRRR